MCCEKTYISSTPQRKLKRLQNVRWIPFFYIICRIILHIYMYIYYLNAIAFGPYFLSDLPLFIFFVQFCIEKNALESQLYDIFSFQFNVRGDYFTKKSKNWNQNIFNVPLQTLDYLFKMKMVAKMQFNCIYTICVI